MITFERKLWHQGYQYIAGVDEAGRGPLAGPVVAAAVVFPQNQREQYGITDSKMLSEKKRLALIPIIWQHALDIGIGIVYHDEIDQIGILNATYRAMSMAVVNLSFVPHYVLVDGMGTPKLSIPCDPIVKGDRKSLSIAAASIIAKVTRDDLMSRYHQCYPEYNFIQHKGYPTPGHVNAIRQHGLSPIHRRSFHPKALNQMSHAQVN